jgi:rhamnulokinase
MLALDLGAESGRAMLGRFDGDRLELDEIHRFANIPVRLPDGLHWDVLHLWHEVKQGIGLAARDRAPNLVSIGIDTWAVDFGLLDRQGNLLSNPYHYRDSRTDGMLDEAFRRVPRAEIFEQTGIQFLQINSLYQLLALTKGRSPVLEIAQTFLTIPDLLNYWLTGQTVCEFSNATTTQCYNPRQKGWAVEMLQDLGIPTHIFPRIVSPGTELGPLLPSVADEIGMRPETGRGPTVIAPACHDTGSAVVAVPAAAGDFAWISSGTWSVVGAEVPEPIIDEQSLGYNFTNEGGASDTFRFSRNVMGLWLVQECRRTWAQQGQEYDYGELTEMAAQAEPFLAVIDPDHGEFFKPGDMPARIGEFCRATGQPVPESKGAIVRCALEGIALKYRWVLERLEEMLGRRLEPVYIVGGGTQNQLLSQFTADAVDRQVITGPVEATATGNILLQLMALGQIDSLQAGRQVVRSSFDLASYEPGSRRGWDEAYGRLLQMMR